MRTAFYPCCGRDFEFAAKVVSPYAEEIVFCDRSQQYLREFSEFKRQTQQMECHFVIGDARDVIHNIDSISVFFHRGVVAPGEGSADVYFFGKKYLSQFAPKFLDNGLIISDGNGSGDKIFQRMIRAQGYTRFGRHFSKVPDFQQPDEFGLFRISARILGAR